LIFLYFMTSLLFKFYPVVKLWLGIGDY